MFAAPDPGPVRAILDSFDWRKLRRVMKTAGHRWTFTDPRGKEYRAVPSADELRDAALALLRNLLASKTGVVTRGGLVAVRLGRRWSLTYEVLSVGVEEYAR